MEHIVIVGASAAGNSAAKEIRSVNSHVHITMLSDEERYPYYRPYLTELIANDKVVEKPGFFLNKKEWYEQNNIELKLGERVTEIDFTSKAVTTSGGNSYSYDKLILANGSNPFVPLKESMDKINVFCVRSYDDALEVNEYARKVKSAVIIGGGLLGLEAADSLNSQGLDVTIIELEKRLLKQHLDEEGSAIIESIIDKSGLRLVLGHKIEEIVGDTVATGIKLDSGEVVQADMIIFSVGIRSNIDLVRDTDIKVERAVVVNEKMETTIPDVYACGDVSQLDSSFVALWMPAVKKGKVAGANAAGRDMIFHDEPYPAILNSFGTNMYSYGEIGTKDNHEYSAYGNFDPNENTYKKLFFKNNILVGFILINKMKQAQKLSNAVKEGKAYQDVIDLVSN